MIVVDTSVWISSLLRNDVNFAPSRAWLGRTLADRLTIVVPTLFVVEVGGGVARRTGDPRFGQRAVDDILRSSLVRLVALDRELARAAAQIAVQLRLRGADATYVATAQRLGFPLVTWDREQRERAAAVIETMTPSEA